MLRHRYNRIGFFAALLVFLQALAPTFGLAEVSVRYAGAPASSKPCAQALVYGDTGGSRTYSAPMSCCANMAKAGPCPAMANGHMPALAATSTKPDVLSATRCIVTVKPLNATPVVARSDVHRWYYQASPALAPPAQPVVLLSVASICVTYPLYHTPFYQRPSTDSHALRAPPVA